MPDTEPVAIVDIETRSVVNLKRCGVSRYAGHPSTQVLCLAWGWLQSDDEPELWLPGDPVPPALVRHIEAGGMVAAWNVAFDLSIWQAKLAPGGWPELAIDQVHDIAAQAAAASLPRGLEKCAQAIGLPINKDRAGALALRALMAPAKWVAGRPVWREPEGERMALVGSYCRQDVKVERQAMRWLPPMQEAERPVMLGDLRINRRGIFIDPHFVRVAGPFHQRALAHAHAAGARISGGMVRTITNNNAVCDWLESLGVRLESAGDDDAGEDDGGDDPEAPPAKGSRKGAMTKAAVRAMLDRPDLPPAVREFLELRQASVRTSTTKVLTLAAATDPRDWRIHDTLTYHAASTGRAGGALLQPQNLPRVDETFDDRAWQAALFDMYGVNQGSIDLAEFDRRHGPPMATLVKMIRGAIIAPWGHELVGGDFEQIELRVNGWLAGDQQLIDLLAANVDVYRRMAAVIYGIDEQDISPDQRQVGKSATLGCGFGLGARKFVEFVLTNTGLTISDDLAQRAVQAFRRERHPIPALWRDLEVTALEALHDPGKVYPCANGRLAFWCAPGKAWLILRLPSGRVLRYRQPGIQVEDTGFGPREVLNFWGVNQITRRWGLERSWGGPLVENAVQATARDLLMQAVQRIEARGWPVVLHVHDEALSEVRTGTVTPEEYAAEMSRPLSWTEGLPIKVKPWAGRRYG